MTSGCEEFALFPANRTSPDPVDSDALTGKLKVWVCDDPFPVSEIKSVEMTFIKGEVRRVADSTEESFTTFFEDTLVVDLLKYRNGLIAELGEIELDTGRYDQIRLYVDKAKLVLKKGNRMFILKVPSGSSSGIKIYPEPHISISEGAMAGVLIDFNLDKSFIVKGNPDTPAGIKGFNFTPVVRAVLLEATGTIEGTVSDSEATLLEGASVWIASDTVVSKTYSDADGYYALPGILPGTYELFATMESHDTLSRSVEVAAGMTEVQNFVLTADQSD
jgi:hypothetical protein